MFQSNGRARFGVIAVWTAFFTAHRKISGNGSARLKLRLVRQVAPTNEADAFLVIRKTRGDAALSAIVQHGGSPCYYLFLRGLPVIQRATFTA
jgi:hypothetical protein